MSAPLRGSESASPVPVLLVSDVRLYRDGLVWGLAGSARVRIAATAESGAEALARVHDASPAVLLVDMAMAEALQLIRAVRISRPDINIVAFAVSADDAALGCIEAGAAGYVAREASLDDLVAAVESVVRGETACSPRFTASLFRHIATLAESRTGEPTATLTPREREIADLIGQGLSNREIAAHLGIELATAKNHVHNILEKLQVRRRSQVGVRLARHQRAPAPERPVLRTEGSRSAATGI